MLVFNTRAHYPLSKFQYGVLPSVGSETAYLTYVYLPIALHKHPRSTICNLSTHNAMMLKDITQTLHFLFKDTKSKKKSRYLLTVLQCAVAVESVTP
jgi:hypothetical protein